MLGIAIFLACLFTVAPNPSSCSSGAAAGVVLLPLAPAAAPPEQLLGLALIPDPYSEQVPGSA